MKRLMAVLAGWSLGGLSLLAQPLAGSAAPDPNQMVREEKHFLECLAYVYSPALWISYNDSLYFEPKTEAQARQIDALKSARAQYVALTNRELRHELVAQILTKSGLDKSWQRKILLPRSETNQSLTPILGRPITFVATYQVLQKLGEGDALLQTDAGACFVMNFGRGMEDGSGTNAVWVREGTKTYSTGSGGSKTVEAFTSVSLSKEETAVLNRAGAAFRKQAAAFAPAVAGSKDKDEFEDCLARATDSNPYMEYIVARDYLAGKGTPKDEKLGLEWMRKAAKSGSGDARRYLENR